MKRFFIVFFIFFFVSIVAPAVASTDDSAKETMQTLLNNEQFEKLEILAEKIRKSRKVLDNGGSALSQFYNNVTETHGKEKEIIRLISLCEKWKRAYPNSPTPLISLSMLHSLMRPRQEGAAGAGP